MVSSDMVRLVLQSAKRYGLDTQQLLAQAGIDLEVANLEAARVPFAAQEKLWQAAWEASGDPCFGLNTGIHAQPGNYKILGYIGMNCATAKDALDAVERYQAIIGGGGNIAIARDAQGCHYGFTPVNDHKAVSHQRVCAVLAACISILRWLVGDTFTPQRAEFTAPRPADISQYETFFRCPVEFAARGNCLHFSAKTERTPIPHASDELLLLLRQQADTLLQQLEPDKEFSTRVARLLAAGFDAGEPTRDYISDKLGMSTRSLQRKLADEGTTWKQVLDQTRYQLALQYLQRGQLDVASIAGLLGYTEPSAFYRAFKKWHGATPGQFRAALESAEAG